MKTKLKSFAYIAASLLSFNLYAATYKCSVNGKIIYSQKHCADEVEILALRPEKSSLKSPPIPKDSKAPVITPSNLELSSLTDKCKEGADLSVIGFDDASRSVKPQDRSAEITRRYTGNIKSQQFLMRMLILGHELYKTSLHPDGTGVYQQALEACLKADGFNRKEPETGKSRIIAP